MQKKLRGYLKLENDKYKEVLPFYQGINTVGRNPLKNSITIRQKSVSETHFQFVCSDKYFIVSDLNSKNGLYINSLENRIQPKTQVKIDPKIDILYISEVKCVIQLLQQQQNQQTCAIKLGQSLISEKNNSVSKEKNDDWFSFGQQLLSQQTKIPMSNNVSREAISKKNEKISEKSIETKSEQSENAKNKKNLINKKIPLINQSKQKQITELEIESEQEKQKFDKKQIIDKIKQNKKKRGKRVSKTQENKKEPRISNEKSKKAKSSQKKQMQRQRESKGKNKKSSLRGNQINQNQRLSVEPKQKKQIDNSTVVTKIKSKPNRKSHKQSLNNRKCSPKNIQNKQGTFSHPKRSLPAKKILLSVYQPAFTPNNRIKILQDSHQDYQILVMGQFRRTYKLLHAICKGVPIVSPEWLIRSQYYQKAIRPEQYQLKQNRDIIRQSLKRIQEGTKIFKGLKFYLGSKSDQYHLKVSQIQTLIQMCDGQITSKIKNSKSTNQVIIIMAKDYKQADVKELRKYSSKIYTIQLILDACFKQEINWDENKL